MGTQLLTILFIDCTYFLHKKKNGIYKEFKSNGAINIAERKTYYSLTSNRSIKKDQVFYRTLN